MSWIHFYLLLRKPLSLKKFFSICSNNRVYVLNLCQLTSRGGFASLTPPSALAVADFLSLALLVERTLPHWDSPSAPRRDAASLPTQQCRLHRLQLLSAHYHVIFQKFSDEELSDWRRSSWEHNCRIRESQHLTKSNLERWFRMLVIYTPPVITLAPFSKACVFCEAGTEFILFTNISPEPSTEPGM